MRLEGRYEDCHSERTNTLRSTYPYDPFRCVLVGANNVVNPAARESKYPMIYGMPVIVLKRSMVPGFAGIENNLFYKDNARMLFGDAKTSIEGLVSEFKKK